MKVEFFKHNIGSREIREVNKILTSYFLTTGQEVDKFEDLFSKYLKCKYTIGLTSCTAGLQLALEAFDIGRGDEVITTPLSFIATSNAVIQAGAKPIFVDVKEDSGNINEDLIEGAISKRTKAIMPVHLYGRMCDMEKIRKIADKYKLKVIEDAAHCIEGELNNVRPAMLSDAACFSFYATKSITCGEGGALSTNNKNLAEKIRKMRLHGLTKSAAQRYEKKFSHWDMEEFGWKYNMDNIQAALLINQVKNLGKYWERRDRIWRKYESAFRGIDGIEFFEVPDSIKHARHLFTICVSPDKRDNLIKKLNSQGVGAVVNYRPIHLMKYYKNKFGYKKGDFPVTEQIGRRTISLPLYPKLKDKEVDYIIKAVKKYV